MFDSFGHRPASSHKSTPQRSERSSSHHSKPQYGREPEAMPEQGDRQDNAILDPKSWQVKLLSMAISVFIIFESLETMLSLTYFNKTVPSVEAQIAESNAWLTEVQDYDRVPYDHPDHPTKNQATHLQLKYSEFTQSYFQILRTQFPLQPIQVAANIHKIVIAVSAFKIILALLIFQGERRAGNVIVWVINPLRLLFYYNPFSMYNQPIPTPKSEEAVLGEDDFQSFQNAAKLRECYREIEMTLVMMAAMLLVMSSVHYGQSKWLMRFYKNTQRSLRRVKHWAKHQVYRALNYSD